MSRAIHESVEAINTLDEALCVADTHEKDTTFITGVRVEDNQPKDNSGEPVTSGPDELDVIDGYRSIAVCDAFKLFCPTDVSPPLKQS